jgi:hypothetical protein
LIANDALAYFFIDQWQYSRRFYKTALKSLRKGYLSIKIEMREAIRLYKRFLKLYRSGNRSQVYCDWVKFMKRKVILL